MTRVSGTPDERFDAKWVVDLSTGCHVWTASLNTSTGYGGFYFAGRRTNAHVYAYERKRGPVPSGLVLDHFACSRHECVNPDHLRPVSRRENTLRSDHSRSAVNLAKTHCVRGHEFTPENTYIRQDTGGRVCRLCSTLREFRRRTVRPTTVEGRKNKSTTP